MGSQEDRERLKEEYKEHFRAIRDLKKKAAESERMARISSALNNVNTQTIMDSFDQALHKVKETIEIAEAKIEMAIESRLDDHGDEELREIEQRRRAQETLRNLKSEMGTLENHLDSTVEEIKNSPKTLGPSTNDHSLSDTGTQSISKSLGPKK
jgi:Sec-independent protein translocase protein TatA